MVAESCKPAGRMHAHQRRTEHGVRFSGGAAPAVKWSQGTGHVEI